MHKTLNTLNTINILTYNVYWRSVIGEYKDICFDNVINNIKQNINDIDPDIICLQEASNHKNILKKIINNNNYDYIINHSGRETMITIIKKYLISSNTIIINTEFHKGRPITIIDIPEYKLYITNIHAPHFKQIELLNSVLNKHMKKIKKDKDYDFIICGDFNLNLNKKVIILDRPIYNYHKFITYITNFKNLIKIKSNNLNISKSLTDDSLLNSLDNIITSIKSNNHEIKLGLYSNNKIASDHLPLVASIDILSKIYKVGYDFDGVIHRHVGDVMKDGSRHPLIYNINEYRDDILFDKIIMNIKNYINKIGIDNIYIITKRSDKCKNKILNYLDQYGKIKLNKDNIICTSGQSKVKYIKCVNINEFYDDSHDNIIDILNNKDKLNIDKLYLTIPEKYKIKQIKIN